MAVFTTSVTINQAKLPDGTTPGLIAGRAEITNGSAFGPTGRTVEITAIPATGYEFVNFIVEEQILEVSSIEVGVNLDTQNEVCLPANNLGVSRRLYFTVNPATKAREPGVALDPDGNEVAVDGFYAAGNNQYYRLQKAILNGPFNCSKNAGPGIASTVQLSPPGYIFRRTGQSGTFDIIIKDATGRTLADKPVIWSSDKPNVASVDQNGRVTAGDTNGIATIRASVKNSTGLQTEAFTEAKVNVQIPQ